MLTIKTHRQRMLADPFLTQLNAALFEVSDLRFALQAKHTEFEQLLSEYRESVDSAVERGNQIVLLKARIAELETVPPKVKHGH